MLAVAVLAGSFGAAWTEAAAADAGHVRNGDAVKRKRTGARRTGDLAIFVLADGADPRAAAREMGVAPVRIYTDVFSGFAADISVVAVARSSRTSRVRAIAPDAPMSAVGQEVPTGVQRIGQVNSGDQPTAEKTGKSKQDRKESKIRKGNNGNHGKNGKKDRRRGNRNDGTGGSATDPPGVDVAILDSGVTASSDLPVAGGVSCTESSTACVGRTWTDVTGHGTHVAGIVAAADNDRGVVGVAPDARIWSVRVLRRGSNGAAVGWVSDVIAGLDWVYQKRGTIDVVNMSLGGWMSNAGGPNDAYRLAIKRVTGAGIPVVAAAGNAGQDALDNGSGMQFVPAAYPEAIAVSAFADSDGRPGGTGGKTCSGDRDDTFWEYSNFGGAVDIAAPGVCILSLTPGGGTALMSGTSMAAPHVAGALALFAAGNPGASEPEARDWLLSAASVAQTAPAGFAGDRDQGQEPVLRLGP